MFYLARRCLISLFLSASAASDLIADADSAVEYRNWIVAMKSAERGPFTGVRWFCKDGSVLPPRPYGCEANGGGVQHGLWSERTLTLREQGYLISTFLAGINPDELLADPNFDNVLGQKLIEQFLLSIDDGWIFRQALFYRGAIQEEGERRGSRALLTEMISRPEWMGPHYTQLRVAGRLLPHGKDSASVQKVRQLSTSLSDRNIAFKPLRAKIHAAPDAADAARVRNFAASLESVSEREPYQELATEIDLIYQAEPLHQELEQLADKYTDGPWLQELLRDAAADLRADSSSNHQYFSTATLLKNLRDALPQIRSHSVRLEILDLNLRVETHNFQASTELRSEVLSATRLQRLQILKAAGQAAYGSGLINARLLSELNHSIEALGTDEVKLDQYLNGLNYLGRVPGWGSQSLGRYFAEAMAKLAEIEPLAHLFIQDQLRGSPLLFFSYVLDSLSRDANRVAGVKHHLFDESIGSGLTALNPGLANGILHSSPDLNELEDFRSDGIYVLPETVSELPPVAGILTGGEGNPLSHVQLLARNLGIPNVTVDSALLPRLVPHDGERVVLAVSKSGLVELMPWSDNWAEVFASSAAQQGVRIEPDLEKLDLSVEEFVPLDKLRATDSGRTVGPKAAKLGELHVHYPNSVSRGVAIPFGLFRKEVLQQPYAHGPGSVFDWMVSNYERLAEIPTDDEQHAVQTEAFRAELYDILVNTKPSDSFRKKLQVAMSDTFGAGASPGVFIRSDTNVEDLAGFTGAGLNLTLPNVVDFDELLKGIVQVWASPFTARAFAWRQSLMTKPEHVYTSILLLEAVASDKSGVLVTQDIDTGNREIISVAVNEGLGGAVDGQAAESLRIALDGSFVNVLATATAPWRRVPNPAGGLQLLPSSNSDAVLQPAEIAQLIDFAKNLPSKFPPITDDEGNSAPADVEFGFVAGKLKLFQIRPFLESKQARGIGYLHEMEARLSDVGTITIQLNEVPQ